MHNSEANVLKDYLTVTEREGEREGKREKREKKRKSSPASCLLQNAF